ncbi:hypothetical protein GQ53DRAFT_398624 [Thozetella sp. PMI_491]|nr:hypothetical protein GQ53DRAFT_398624 [Thozetella sp. PMI_491]
MARLEAGPLLLCRREPRDKARDGRARIAPGTLQLWNPGSLSQPVCEIHGTVLYIYPSTHPMYHPPALDHTMRTMHTMHTHLPRSHTSTPPYIAATVSSLGAPRTYGVRAAALGARGALTLTLGAPVLPGNRPHVATWKRSLFAFRNWPPAYCVLENCITAHHRPLPLPTITHHSGAHTLRQPTLWDHTSSIQPGNPSITPPLISI